MLNICYFSKDEVRISAAFGLVLKRCKHDYCLGCVVAKKLENDCLRYTPTIQETNDEGLSNLCAHTFYRCIQHYKCLRLSSLSSIAWKDYLSLFRCFKHVISLIIPVLQTRNISPKMYQCLKICGLISIKISSSPSH